MEEGMLAQSVLLDNSEVPDSVVLMSWERREMGEGEVNGEAQEAAGW